jgi:hypothetical protein
MDISKGLQKTINKAIDEALLDWGDYTQFLSIWSYLPKEQLSELTDKKYPLHKKYGGAMFVKKHVESSIKAYRAKKD